MKPRNVFVLAATLLVLGLTSTPIAGDLSAAQSFARDHSPPSVDFRMTPLEQAKKIYARLYTGDEPGQARTIMNGSARLISEPHHMIVDEKYATSLIISDQLNAATRLDSLSWWRPGLPETLGACDSDQECEQETNQMCENAGHGGVQNFSVAVTTHEDGSKTCSGDCEENGAIAFVTCSPS